MTLSCIFNQHLATLAYFTWDKINTWIKYHGSQQSAFYFNKTSNSLDLFHRS